MILFGATGGADDYRDLHLWRNSIRLCILAGDAASRLLR